MHAQSRHESRRDLTELQSRKEEIMDRRSRWRWGRVRMDDMRDRDVGQGSRLCEYLLTLRKEFVA